MKGTDRRRGQVLHGLRGFLCAALVALACPVLAADHQQLLIGNWSCESGPCWDEEIAFAFEDGEFTFNSWLHERPSASGGAWRLEGDRVSVECCDGLRYEWTIVRLTDTELVMQEETESEPTVLKRIGPPSACASPEHYDFDFWIGDWNVTTPDGKPAGSNHIEKILDGCVIYEHWTSATSGFAGRSFNTYDPVSGTWNQAWVDTGGSTIHFHGRRKDNVMDMEGTHVTKEGTLQYKLSFTLNADGSVRQWWQQSRDGRTWETIFDGLYTRK